MARITPEEIVATIDAIVRSPVIVQYKMGITRCSPIRRKQYLGVGFEHFVVIDTQLPVDDALEKEQEVFSLLTKSSDQRSILYTEYHHESRDKTTPRSLGGKERNQDDRYDLYIAWWNR